MEDIKIDLQKVISVHRYKNGNIKVYHTTENEGNIYRYLKSFGFSETRIKGKRAYLRKEKGLEVEEISFNHIKRYFWSLLETEKYFNKPDGITKESLLNWFLKDNPIRRNNIFDYYLNDSSRFRF